MLFRSFIRRDEVESIDSDEFRCFEETVGSEDIGHEKWVWILDALVHMALCSKVCNKIWLLLHKYLQHLVSLYDIFTIEYESIREILDRFLQIIEISRIGELIHDDDSIVTIFPENMIDEVGSDEARSASDENSTFHSLWN